MSTIKGRNFSTSSSNDKEYFGVSEFEKLSRRVSSKRFKNRNESESTATEYVYESMMKELTSKEHPQFSKLVKRASGILKLSQIQQRRPATVPDLETFDYDDFFYELNNRSRRNEEQLFSSHLEKNQDKIISKLAKNGGDFSEIWDDFEAISYSGSSYDSARPSSLQQESRSSITGKLAEVAFSLGRPALKRPIWKYFANHNGLSSTSTTSIASSISSNMSNSASKRLTKQVSTQRPFTAPKPKPKSEYMRHVFVVKGQVVTFKANEFDKFSNWFGDDDLLKQCSRCNGEFRRELDLSCFTNSEIRIKLYEGYKLVVEAYRPIRNGLPPLRHKSTILLPAEVHVDKLLMCRTANGRLVIIQTSNFRLKEKK